MVKIRRFFPDFFEKNFRKFLPVALDPSSIYLENYKFVSIEGAPDAVLSFVDRHFESVEHLEILLLLAAQERTWSAPEIFQKIQSSQASVDQRLNALLKAGLIARENDGKFRFAPKDDEARQLVKELAGAYKTRPVKIIETIYARKTDAVRCFADAFKFRKD